jgi:hypothetical protein
MTSFEGWLITGLIIGIAFGFLVIHPGFQVVSSSQNEHGYNTPVMFYDDGKYGIVRHDSSMYWKLAIPFITPEIPQIRIEDPYEYNTQVKSSDGVLMNAKISYKMTTDEYFDNDLWKRNARMYGLHWQEIMARQACDKVAIQVASKHTAEYLFRNGYYDLPILINFRYIDKAQEVALKAKIETNSADPYMKAYVRDGSYNYESAYTDNYNEYAKMYGVEPIPTNDVTANSIATWNLLKDKYPDLSAADVNIDKKGFYEFTAQGKQKGFQ